MLKRTLCPLPLLDERIVLEECTKRGINHKHAYTMWRHIVAKGVTDVDEIPGLPKALYQLVREKFVITTSTLESYKTSEDKSTTKLLIRLQDGALVETVIMRYGRFELKNFPSERQRRAEDGNTVFASKERATVCVSSQVGCQMGCTFCATGTMGLLSNLTSGEILEQLYHANTIEKIRNVVFMGMGEPLDNYDAVVMAVKGMTDVRRFSLSPSRIAVSTVGVVPKMLKMAEDIPEVGLAVSLHAPTQELRQQIVPTAKAWHIDRIINAMEHFIEHRSQVASRRSHVLIEYVLIADINSSEEVAHQLGTLLQGREVILNVIPYNPTDVPHDYKPPTPETVERFNAVLREYDLRTIVRQELGQDVNAACGQLVISSQKRGDEAAQAEAAAAASCSTDIEELFAIPEHLKVQQKKQRQQQQQELRRRRTARADATTSTTSTTSTASSGPDAGCGCGSGGCEGNSDDGESRGASARVERMREVNDTGAAVRRHKLKMTVQDKGARPPMIPGVDNRIAYGLIVFFAAAAVRLGLKVLHAHGR